MSSEKESCEKALKEAENQKQQQDTSLKASVHRCEELLEELNQMNKALRERGERISRLEAAHQEKSGELEATAALLKELQSKVREKWNHVCVLVLGVICHSHCFSYMKSTYTETRILMPLFVFSNYRNYILQY